MSNLLNIRFQVEPSNHYFYSAFVVIVDTVLMKEWRSLLSQELDISLETGYLY